MLALLWKVVATHTTSGMCGGGHAPISSSLHKGEPMDRLSWHAASRIVYNAHVKKRCDWQRSSAFTELISCVVPSLLMAVTSCNKL